MKEDWKKNFRILWFGSLITGMGNAMTLPFIVLFIDTLGNFNNTELNFLGFGIKIKKLFIEKIDRKLNQ